MKIVNIQSIGEASLDLQGGWENYDSEENNFLKDYTEYIKNGLNLDKLVFIPLIYYFYYSN